jgi:hypothetical protein
MPPPMRVLGDGVGVEEIEDVEQDPDLFLGNVTVFSSRISTCSACHSD